MVDICGDYCFDPRRLSDVHQKCLSAAKDAFYAGKVVVVSNTFTQKWEMQPYMDVDPKAEMLICRGNFENIHGVPKEKVAAMAVRWEE
jgi:ATP-dependent protease Clp ATPase subunit